jgi:tetratricopeptide (TPR) repeat protein
MALFSIENYRPINLYKNPPIKPGPSSGVQNTLKTNKVQSYIHNLLVDNKLAGDTDLMTLINNFLRESSFEDETLVELGYLLFNNGYKDLAKEVLERLLREQPLQISVLITLGEVYEELGLSENFELLYGNILDRYPDQIMLFENLAHFYFERSDPERAFSIIELGIEKNQHNPALKSLLGDYLEIQGQHQPAIKYYEAAIELDPEEAANYFKIGNLLFNLGNKPAAEEWFNQVMGLSPDYADLVDQLPQG